MPRGRATAAESYDREQYNRDRHIAALYEVLARAGHAQVSVAEVIEQANSPRQQFYYAFKDIDELIDEAHKDGLARIEAIVSAAWAGNREVLWQERVSATVGAVLALFDAHPEFALAMLIMHAQPGSCRQRNDRGRSRAAVELSTSALASGDSRTAASALCLTLGRMALGAGAELLMRRLLESSGELSGGADEITRALVLPLLGFAHTKPKSRPKRARGPSHAAKGSATAA